MFSALSTIIGIIGSGGKLMNISKALLLVFIGIAIGLWTTSIFYKAKYSDNLKKQINVIEEKYESKLKAKQRELDAASQTINELFEKIDNISKASAKSKREVIRYVKENSDCDITRGAVSLLNDARKGSADRMSNTKLSFTEKQAASTVTQRKEIEAHIQCAIQYNKLAAMHDALVDSINNINKLAKEIK